ncbi:MAG: hypothetical protein KatS3mg076_0350 [Candidatus Binatia bacterium]|nr:MAG: hypothetical protein KatS3mg076_0350 [Candidatus Binatia bacterium]
MNTFGLVLLGLAVLSFRAPAEASAEPDAQKILSEARRIRQEDWQWTDRVQKLRLEIVDRRGGKRTRELDYYQKKYPRDRSRSLVFFRSPPEVKGTGFLQWVDPHGRNQQWLYLPALKRVRQISGRSQRESFMGTDFSYEDLAIVSEILDWTESDARVSFSGTAPCGEDRCRKLRFEPDGKDVAYGEIVVWIDDGYRLRRLEFFDPEKRPWKVLDAADFRDVDGIPTPFRLEMANLRSGSRTVVLFESVRYGLGLDDATFSQRRLERGP